MDVVSTFLVAVTLFVYGTGTSWFQERFGLFQDLPAGVKQLINSIINLVVPYVIIYLQPYWKVEFGDSTQVVTSLFVLVAPFFVWMVSQVAHHFDPARFIAGTFVKR